MFCFHIQRWLKKNYNRLHLFVFSTTNRGVHIGKNVFFARYSSLVVKSEAELSIGDDCFFNKGCSIACFQKISIGANCLFGENVKIYDHNHKFRMANIPISDQGYSSAAVIIGSNVWCGSNVCILRGAIIGDHCVIGANCVVSGNVPSNTIFRVGENSFNMQKMDNFL